MEVFWASTQQLAAYFRCPLLILCSIAVGFISMPAASETPPAAPSANANQPVKHNLSTSDANAEGNSLALQLNAASWLLYGQTINVEYGKHVSGTLRLRSLNAGLVNKQVWQSVENTSSAAFSPGFGLIARYYSSRRGSNLRNLRGLYSGAALEYHLFRGKQPELDWAVGTLVPSLEFGYRWVLGHVIVGLGAAIGWGFEIHRQRQYWFGYEDEGSGTGRDFGGLLFEGNLEIGWVF